MTEEDGQVTEGGEQNTEEAENEEAKTVSAEDFASLQQELAELKASQAQGQQQEKWEPKPLMTEEQIEAIEDEERKVLYKALNEEHMSRQRIERRLEELEANNEETGQKESIRNFITSHAQLSKDANLASQFEKELNRILKSDGTDLLDAIAHKVLSAAKGKPNKQGATTPPRNVAGSVKKGVTKTDYRNAEEGMRAAKEELLQEFQT